MKKSLSVLVLLIIGIGIGGTVAVLQYSKLSALLGLAGSPQVSDVKSEEKKPLYWVAPMDPNYKRDKPGKSPMGMDLIAVYKEESSGPDTGPGTVRISPDIVNNLGVRVAPVKRGFLHDEIQTVGYVGYDQDQLVQIHPRVEGWIEKLYIKASGDPVKKGQPIYEIYSPALVNAQEELMLALDRKTPRLIRAAENRLAALRVPEKVIERLRKTREVRQTVTFYAPQSGVVDNLKIRQGIFVKPGSTIMSIGTLAQVWVEAEIFERQAFQVAVGLPVTMTLDYLPGKEWDGVVDYVYPTLDVKTRTVRIRLRFENEDEMLKPNMFAQVLIHANSDKKALLVPREAVIRTGRSNRVVLVVGDGRFKSIDVKVGRFDDNSAEILSGLEDGDKVVISAQFLMDSESSKTSDFRRMRNSDEAVPDSVWVKATVNSLMTEHRMVNLSHKAIASWDWPEMNMDFTVAESVDFATLKKGLILNVEISKLENDQYQISKIQLPGSVDESKSLDDLSFDDMSMDDMSLDDVDSTEQKK